MSRYNSKLCVSSSFDRNYEAQLCAQCSRTLSREIIYFLYSARTTNFVCSITIFFPRRIITRRNSRRDARKNKLEIGTCVYARTCRRQGENSAKREGWRSYILFGGRLAEYIRLYLRHSSRISRTGGGFKPVTTIPEPSPGSSQLYLVSSLHKEFTARARAR